MKADLRFAGRAMGLALLAICTISTGHASTATTTILGISPSGSVSAGTVVTLTATVTNSSGVVNPGQVIFCEAAAAHCEDSAILGQAQLTASGVATLLLRFGVGSHSIKAVFVGTPHSATPETGSSSAVGRLSVTAGAALARTSSTVSAAGAAGGYTLTGTVVALGRATPGGTLSFLDASQGDAVLGSTSLSGITALGFAQSLPPSPTDPEQIVEADFNGDGIPDLATLGYQNGDITLVYGKGDGTFTNLTTLGTYTNPSEMVVADFNSDGIPALGVAAISEDGYFEGTFYDLESSTYIGVNPASIVAADVNGDGIPDLVVSNSTEYLVRILLGKGDGSFTFNSSAKTPPYPDTIVVGDFNGDGSVDIAVGSQINSASAPGSVSILWGDGTGTFNPGLNYVVGSYPLLATGDFNGDGLPDLVTANMYDGTLTVLLANGSGGFTTMTTPRLFVQPSSIVTADMNGDGITDLVVADSSAFTVTVLAGKGDGTFTKANVTSVPGIDSAWVQDLNGDGIDDVFTANGFVGDESVLLGGLMTRAAVDGISLGAGTHSIVASYSGDAHYASSESAPLSITNTAAVPVLTPNPGTYLWTQSVALSDSTPGATLYYTLDGSTPTTSSARYVAPIEVSWQAAIQAIAVAPGAANSGAAAGTYEIERRLSPPVFSAPSGTYSGPLTFSLTCRDDSCASYYNINGGSFMKYTGPITISGTSVVKAFATEWHFTTSEAAEVTYNIKQ